MSPLQSTVRQRVHVVMNQHYLLPERLPGKTVVVFDVLLATTTIAMALHLGASEVYAVAEVETAKHLAQRFDRSEVILAGEKDASVPDGFESFQPSKLQNLRWAGKRLILVSTNGTVALQKSQSAANLYSCALVNAKRTAEQILQQHHEGTILLVCAASKQRFNMEDFIGAGLLINRLLQAEPGRFELSDSAQTAHSLAANSRPADLVRQSRVADFLESSGMLADVNLACIEDSMPVIAKWSNGCMTNAAI